MSYRVHFYTISGKSYSTTLQDKSDVDDMIDNFAKVISGNGGSRLYSILDGSRDFHINLSHVENIVIEE